jgi:hypothetical protein
LGMEPRASKNEKERTELLCWRTMIIMHASLMREMLRKMLSWLLVICTGFRPKLQFLFLWKVLRWQVGR